jgi:anti-sigma-K factor RskA
MSTDEHTRWSEDVAAYMLGALESEEVAEFERHLASCTRCQGEIRWFKAAVEVLPEAVESQEPPPQLRERLIKDVRADARAAAAASRSAESGARGWLGRLLHGSGRYGRRPLAAVAALALVVVAIGGYEIGSGGEGGGQGGTSTIVSGKAPDVTAEVVRKGDSAEVKLANVGELPKGRVLQAWVQRDGEIEAVPALFVPDRNGTAATSIADMSDVEVVMVTREPSGGSKAPTSSPIATVPIPG